MSYLQFLIASLAHSRYHLIYYKMDDCRELMEECGLVANALHKIGILMFEFVGDPQLMEVHVFTTNDWEGTITESDGM